MTAEKKGGVNGKRGGATVLTEYHEDNPDLTAWIFYREAAESAPGSRMRLSERKRVLWKKS